MDKLKAKSETTKLKKDGTKSRQGENGGRPAKYTSGELLWLKANDFFELCDKTRQLPEKAGLCLYLGISRDTYSEYRKKFPDSIKAIDMYIESSWVRRLNGQAATGAIFYLKNAFRDEYKDRHETDITTDGQPITGMKIIKV